MTANRRALAIVNPSSGSQRSDVIVSHLETEAKRQGVDLDIAYTTPEIGARELAKKATDDVGTIIAVGGDGTVSEVIAGTLRKAVTVAVIPGGSTNMIARELGIPLQHHEAARIAIGEGVSTNIDIALAGDRVIVHMAGAGFDAAVMRDTSPRLKRRVRWAAYLPAGARNLNFPRFEYSGTIDGRPIAGKARLILTAIGASIVNPRIVVGKGIDRRDRMIDLLIFDPPRLMDVSQVVFWTLAGRPEQSRWSTHYRGQNICLDSPTDVPFEVDGDYVGKLPIEISLFDEPINVRVPITAI
ncbi:MAG: hypothetical protein M9890_02010 [Thermomicrobiales bacterium]|nr:hypothetical protein [Thermomicrobiales bacterium]